MTTLITATGLRKTYRLPSETLFAPAPVKTALDGVDLEVQRGETLAVIGESGSGKSTLVRLLLGLSRPTAGSIEFEGRPVTVGRARNLRWLRRDTGIVQQDPYASLDPRFTVFQSIAEPLAALRIPGNHRARVIEVLDQVGLPAWRADQYPHELSGGQRQRVALARAIVHGPKLLVGDEPMSALDVTVRAQILELLLGLGRDLGLTILFVSHDIGLVQHFAHRVLVMKDGAVVERGETRAVLAHPEHPYTQQLLRAVPRILERSGS